MSTRMSYEQWLQSLDQEQLERILAAQYGAMDGAGEPSLADRVDRDRYVDEQQAQQPEPSLAERGSQARAEANAGTQYDDTLANSETGKPGTAAGGTGAVADPYAAGPATGSKNWWENDDAKADDYLNNGGEHWGGQDEMALFDSWQGEIGTFDPDIQGKMKDAFTRGGVAGQAEFNELKRSGRQGKRNAIHAQELAMPVTPKPADGSGTGLPDPTANKPIVASPVIPAPIVPAQPTGFWNQKTGAAALPKDQGTGGLKPGTGTLQTPAGYRKGGNTYTSPVAKTPVIGGNPAVDAQKLLRSSAADQWKKILAGKGFKR